MKNDLDRYHTPLLACAESAEEGPGSEALSHLGTGDFVELHSVNPYPARVVAKVTGVTWEKPLGEPRRPTYLEGVVDETAIPCRPGFRKGDHIRFHRNAIQRIY